MKRIVKAGIILIGVLLLALGSLPAAAQVWSPFGARRSPPPDEASLKRDSLDRAFPQGKPSVSSPWREREMRDFAELLKPGRYDIMVAPIRSEGYAVDRISRSLIVKALSAELAARKLRVPNPDALSRALGEGRRTIELGEVVTFARPLGIEKLVTVAVGHDRLGHLTASVGVVPVKRFSLAPKPKPLAEFSLGAGEHPSAISRVIAPAVLDALALSGKPPARGKTAVAAKRALPASPIDAMAIKSDDAVGRAIALQLIASLAPESPERSRERLFEQALIAAQALPREDPFSAFLIARAWHYLEARETALGALADSNAPAALVKLALHHVGRARREHRATAACLASPQPCIAGAYVDLLEAVAVSGPIRELYRLVNMQVLPAQARELTEALKPELDGHPAILAFEGGARLALARRLPD